MSEGETLDAETVRARLPDGWRVENAGSGVCGYDDGDAPGDFPEFPAAPASFAIWKEGNLWSATWKDPHELGEDLHELSDRVDGARERCLEWVVQKARDAQGYSGE